MAVKAARERGQAERGITEPEMVLPESAHAAFHKAAHYFGVTVHKVPVRADWRADVDAMAARVNDNTVLVVGSRAAVPAGRDRPDPRAGRARRRRSARQLPHRRVHGRLRAAVHGAARRRRAAVGLPRRGRHHDLGRHPQARLRAEGRVGDPPPRPRSCAATRRSCSTTGSAASTRRPACRARGRRCRWRRRGRSLHHLGLEGYLRLTADDDRHRAPHGRRRPRHRRARACSASPRRSASRSAPPPATRTRSTCSPSATRCSPRGWHLDRQRPPDSLHATVSAGNAPVIDEFLADLADVRRRGRRHPPRPTAPPATPRWSERPDLRRRAGGGGADRGAGAGDAGAAVGGDRRVGGHPGAPEGGAPARHRRLQAAGRHQRGAPARRRRRPRGEWWRTRRATTPPPWRVAAQRRGIPLHGRDAARASPATKRAATEAAGADVVICDPTLAGPRRRPSPRCVAETGAVEIHPFDDPRVMAGQGTAALELLEAVPEIAHGGRAGQRRRAAVGHGHRRPRPRPLHRRVGRRARRAPTTPSGRWPPGTSCSTAPRDTIADGLVAQLSERTLGILQAHDVQVVTVTDDQIVEAMRRLARDAKQMVEPSGAVALAGLVQLAAHGRARCPPTSASSSAAATSTSTAGRRW